MRLSSISHLCIKLKILRAIPLFPLSDNCFLSMFNLSFTVEHGSSLNIRFDNFKLTDFVCLYTYEFCLSLRKIVRSSVILLLLLHFCNNLVILPMHRIDAHNKAYFGASGRFKEIAIYI